MARNVIANSITPLSLSLSEQREIIRVACGNGSAAQREYVRHVSPRFTINPVYIWLFSEKRRGKRRSWPPSFDMRSTHLSPKRCELLLKTDPGFGIKMRIPSIYRVSIEVSSILIEEENNKILNEKLICWRTKKSVRLLSLLLEIVFRKRR